MSQLDLFAPFHMTAPLITCPACEEEENTAKFLQSDLSFYFGDSLIGAHQCSRCGAWSTVTTDWRTWTTKLIPGPSPLGREDVRKLFFACPPPA